MHYRLTYRAALEHFSSGMPYREDSHDFQADNDSMALREAKKSVAGEASDHQLKYHLPRPDPHFALLKLERIVQEEEREEVPIRA